MSEYEPWESLWHGGWIIRKKDRKHPYPYHPEEVSYDILDSEFVKTYNTKEDVEKRLKEMLLVSWTIDIERKNDLRIWK